MLAVLDYADAIGYTLPHNDLWTATFRLPAADPKKAFCQMHNLVSIDDSPRNIGLYRIISTPSDDVTDLAGYTVYNCEHVAATLLDDILFGYHEIGGGSIRTADVIRYILAQQETPRWQLGVCDFTNRFTYKFENVTLLSALLSLGEVLTEPYTWDFDTTTTPWTVNLRKADTAAGCGIYYARNLQKITKTVDASTLVTRLYLLGYGEGVNQLTIKDINNGLPYLDADTISVYGIKKSVFCDRRFENAESLKARGRALLESLKIPYTTYTAKAADLVQLTGDPWDEFMPGKVVHVMDGEDGVEFEARLVTVAKTNASARSGDLELTIANSVRDIADSINTLADRQGINELYSQGATNLYAQQYADNADAAHPARMKVYIPNGCVRINQMLLSWQLDAFRAYETGAAAGGSTVTTTSAGGASTQTSSAGGASERTSRSGGSASVTVPLRTVSQVITSGSPMLDGAAAPNTGYALESDGTPMSATGAAEGSTGSSGELTTGVSRNADGAKLTTDSGGGGNTGSGGPTSTGAARNSNGAMTSTGSTTAGGSVGDNSAVSGYTRPGTSENGSHSHTVNSHTHNASITHRHTVNDTYTSYNSPGATASSSPGTNSRGGHSHTVDNHCHTMNHGHSFTGSAHTHSMGHWHNMDAHSHSVGAHTHGMSHWHALDAHTHGLGAHTHGMIHRHEHNHYHLVNVAVTIPAQDITIPAHSHVFETSDHTHSVSIEAHTHDLTLADHTHEIVYGIYEGNTASSVTLKVDGNTVPASEIKSDEMDIVGYLAKDEDGKITRGTWHEIEIVPNGLTRIEANLFVQAFVQSVGGGNY